MTYKEVLDFWETKKPIRSGKTLWLMIAKAIEKQIPKKPVRRVVNRGFNLPMPTYVDVCPCCGVDTPIPRDLESWEFWCPDCGQAIDWSEE